MPSSRSAAPPGSRRKPHYMRGFGTLYLKHVTQANEGCDFDFLEAGARDARARDPLSARAEGDRHEPTHAPLAALAAAVLALSRRSRAVAQAWPTRPITYIVPFTPGGIDRRHRPHGRASARAGARPAGGRREQAGRGRRGRRGLRRARRSPTATRCSAARSARTRSTRASTRTCRTTRSRTSSRSRSSASSRTRCIVNPQLGVNSVPELIALLKKDPSKRTFASSGAGTSTHLAGELFADLIGVRADARALQGHAARRCRTSWAARCRSRSTS